MQDIDRPVKSHVVGSVTIVWMITDANNQSSLHCTGLCCNVSCKTILEAKIQAMQVVFSAMSIANLWHVEGGATTPVAIELDVDHRQHEIRHIELWTIRVL